MRRTAGVVAAGALTLGAGIGVSGLASADPSATPSATPTAGSPSSPRVPTDRGYGGPRGGLTTSDLAEKLGVSEDKLTTAVQELREERAGKRANGERPDPATRDAELAKSLADKLDLSEADVKTALDELRAEAQADRAASFKTRLDEAVKAGTLTQAEADAVQKAADKGVIGMGGRGPR